MLRFKAYTDWFQPPFCRYLLLSVFGGFRWTAEALRFQLKLQQWVSVVGVKACKKVKYISTARKKLGLRSRNVTWKPYRNKDLLYTREGCFMQISSVLFLRSCASCLCLNAAQKVGIPGSAYHQLVNPTSLLPVLFNLCPLSILAFLLHSVWPGCFVPHDAWAQIEWDRKE